MAEIDITIKPIHIERAIFIAIIILLSVLLIMQITNQPECKVVSLIEEKQTTNKSTTQTTQEEITTEDETVEEEEESEELEETCDDGIKNQDEEGTDCGGVCGSYWYNETCNIDPEEEEEEINLTGEVEFTINNVEFTEFENDFIILDTYNITIINGLEEDINWEMYVFAYEERDRLYRGDFDYAYALYNLPNIKSGQSYNRIIELKESHYEKFSKNYNHKFYFPEETREDVELEINVTLTIDDGFIIQKTNNFFVELEE